MARTSGTGGSGDVRRPTLSAAWATVAAPEGWSIRAAEVLTVELPFRRPVRTAKGTHSSRPLVLVHLVGATADGSVPAVHGWGECAALADTTYEAEDVDSCADVLADKLLPALVDSDRYGQVTRLPELSALVPDAPLAFAAMEMAVADLWLRASGRSLAGVLGVAGSWVEAGAVIGITDDLGALETEVGRLRQRGFRRIKVKIEPGWDVVPLEHLADRFPDLVLCADANGSYGPAAWNDPTGSSIPTPGDKAGATFGRWLRENGGVLAALEQPFSPNADTDEQVRALDGLGTAVALDEGVHSPLDVDEALRRGLATGVCVKPARLGGIGATLAGLDRWGTSSRSVWIGGRYESGFSRGVLATLSALEEVNVPGDLQPSTDYLADDLVAGEQPIRRAKSENGGEVIEVPVPLGPGMGPPPETGRVETFLTSRIRVL